MRQPGYYHVKFNGEWLIAYCRPDQYLDFLEPSKRGSSTQHHEDYEDDELEEINETRIPSPDELSAAHKEYLEMKKELRLCRDDAQKETLVSKISTLGAKYNFE